MKRLSCVVFSIIRPCSHLLSGQETTCESREMAASHAFWVTYVLISWCLFKPVNWKWHPIQLHGLWLIRLFLLLRCRFVRTLKYNMSHHHLGEQRLQTLAVDLFVHRLGGCLESFEFMGLGVCEAAVCFAIYQMFAQLDKCQYYNLWLIYGANTCTW